MTLTEEIQVNGDKLRQLREERGWDWSQMARLSSLSVSQVQALESGSVDCFYTLAIKNNAARKVAKVLGVPPNEVFIAQDNLPSPDQGEGHDHAMRFETVEIQSRLPAAAPRSSWLGYGVMSLGLVLCWVGFSMQQSTPSAPPEALGAARSTVVPDTASAIPSSVSTPAQPTTAGSPTPTDSPQAVAQAATPAASPVASGPVSRPLTGEVELAPASLNADASCALDSDSTPLQPAKPTKSPEKVSLMFHKAGLLCVQDSTGKVWKEDLKPWVGRTFMGKAPWKLYSPVLTQADVFFQGEKIRVSGVSTQAITLTGKPFNTQ